MEELGETVREGAGAAAAVAPELALPRTGPGRRQGTRVTRTEVRHAGLRREERRQTTHVAGTARQRRPVESTTVTMGGGAAAPLPITATGCASAAAPESTAATAATAPAAPDVGLAECRTASPRVRTAVRERLSAESGARVEAEGPQANAGGAQTSSGTHKKRTDKWTDVDLELAMNSITDDAMSLRQASRVYGIPTSSLRDHLFGKTRSRQKGIKPVLAPHEEKKVVDYVFQMQDLGHPLTTAELRLKVATAT